MPNNIEAEILAAYYKLMVYHASDNEHATRGNAFIRNLLIYL